MTCTSFADASTGEVTSQTSKTPSLKGAHSEQGTTRMYLIGSNHIGDAS
eukprot:CAMPEP_0198333866 /NCGR_PEP_ID=MMETSP1450-20131203/19235_1 /TAXON_ID=753684 ORGANISM="Madagascaria erythrocladiodes, Strain CCMP3234" /NCGR_SAMPLE_ID=MMETSP1450 /ASSEMBLY_ACC=CAM_ASM_001115 /LENGTH=48 /DNA_ID= /DNA_START= /DNA_END= /DNA_ORIENTATION=